MSKDIPDSKCRGPYHGMKPAPFRYCPDCGVMIDPTAHIELECAKFHSLRKSKGNRFCPNCGGKLFGEIRK